MITSIIIFYIVPMLLIASIHWFDKSVKTVGDFLRGWWFYLIPLLNIAVLFGFIMFSFVNKLIEKKVDTKIVDNWTKIMDIKIK
jgi:hypothetical protein